MYSVMADAVITVEGSVANVTLALSVKKDNVPYFNASVGYPTLPVGDGKPDPETGPLAYLESQWLKVVATITSLGIKNEAPESHKLRYSNLAYDQVVQIEILFMELLGSFLEVGLKKSEKKGKKVDASSLKGKFKNENKGQGREVPPVHPKQEHSDKTR